ncbi:hypothetical protein Trydic_g13545 [Trypoxylus dichotomus]
MNLTINLLTSLRNFVDTMRDDIDKFESFVEKKGPEADYKDQSQGTRVINSWRSVNGLVLVWKVLNSEESKHSCKKFAKVYQNDINPKELEMEEHIHVTEYLKGE